MFWPIVACVLLPWLLVYLGLHVVQRGIIFIDIAMAQMASLGICVAVLAAPRAGSSAHVRHRARGSHCWARLCFRSLANAPAWCRRKRSLASLTSWRRPVAILLLSRAADGNEEIQANARRQHPLVRSDEVWRCFGRFRRGRRGALRVAKIVHARLLRSRWRVERRTARALVGFSFLRAVWSGRDDFRAHRRRAAGFQLPDRAGGLRDHVGAADRPASAHWLAHFAPGRSRGFVLSFYWDLPSGAAIVCTFGALLILVSLLGLLRRRPQVLQS